MWRPLATHIKYRRAATLAQERFSSPSACDLLICDEAHRLKNDETLTNKARLLLLAWFRRVLRLTQPMLMRRRWIRSRAAAECCSPARQSRHGLRPLSSVTVGGSLFLRLQNHLDEFYAMVNFANPVRAPLSPVSRSNATSHPADPCCHKRRVSLAPTRSSARSVWRLARDFGVLY